MDCILIKKQNLNKELSGPNISVDSVDIKELLDPCSNPYSVEVSVTKNIGI